MPPPNQHAPGSACCHPSGVPPASAQSTPTGEPPANPGAPRRCALALGSNLGNRLGNLQAAVRALAPLVAVTAISALYESDPVGPPGQPPYFNAVCTGLTSASSDDLLRLAKHIEWSMGRRPGPRWGPRPVDVDILLIDGVDIDTPTLTVPHPRLEERGFVLAPLADILPGHRLSRSGHTVAEQFALVGDDGLRRIAGPDWLTAVYVGPPAPRPTFAAS